MVAFMEPASRNVTRIALQVFLCGHQWFLYLFSCTTLLLFAYKGARLPYPSTGGAYGWELAFLVLLQIVENTRLFHASKGNKTTQLAPLFLSLVLALPVLICHVFYLQLQTYVLRLDQILNGFAIAFVCIEVFLSLLTLLLVLEMQRLA